MKRQDTPLKLGNPQDPLCALVDRVSLLFTDGLTPVFNNVRLEKYLSAKPPLRFAADVALEFVQRISSQVIF